MTAPCDHAGDDGRDDELSARPTAQYFDDDPTVASDPVAIDVSLPDVAFTLQTDRGVFARGRLDAEPPCCCVRTRPSCPAGTCSISAAEWVRSR